VQVSVVPKGDRAIGKADPLDGTTPVANLLLEALAMAHLSGAEKGAVLFLWRRTYGWQDGNKRKTEDEISLPEWAAALDTNVRYAAKVLNGLVGKRVIQRTDLGKGKGYRYSMNTRVDQWDKSCLNGQELSERYSQGLSKKYRPLMSEKAIPIDTNLAMAKESINKEIKERNQAPKRSPDPLNRLRKLVFEGLQERRGNNSPVPGAEAKAITWMLKEGYAVGDILDTYDAMKLDSFWADKFLSMQSVKKQIGEILKKGKRTSLKESIGKPLVSKTKGVRIE
jgi:phage replication O-like protein O